VVEGGASVSEVNRHGDTALFAAAKGAHLQAVQWLLEYGGANIADTTSHGQTVWNLLTPSFRRRDPTAVTSCTALLHVMVLQSSPPLTLKVQLAPYYLSIVRKGAWLRAVLPAYLAWRQAHLEEHCFLIAPLRAIEAGYEEPTTTEELWATEVGAT
jgi:hypothetical protein